MRRRCYHLYGLNFFLGGNYIDPLFKQVAVLQSIREQCEETGIFQNFSYSGGNAGIAIDRNNSFSSRVAGLPISAGRLFTVTSRSGRF